MAEDEYKLETGFGFCQNGRTKDGKRYKIQIKRESCIKILDCLKPNDKRAFIQAYDLESEGYLFDFLISDIADIIVNDNFKIERFEDKKVK